MAPEQAVDARTADALSDVYSVGMVLYQCLAGRPPFDIDPARGPYGVLLAKAEPPEPLSRHAPHVPQEIQSLVMRTLERNPKQRPAMGDLEEALGRYRPPRRAGKTSSAHVVAVNPPIAAGRIAQGDDDGEPTDSVTDDAVALPSLSGSLLQSGTPSEQQARGEISPPGRDGAPLLVPRSISDVPSMPMALPPLTSGPHDRTAKPAPTQGVPLASASPSAPTKAAVPIALERGSPDHSATAPAARGIVLALAGVAVALSIALTAAVWQWPGGQRAPALPSAPSPAKSPVENDAAPRPDFGSTVAVTAPSAAVAAVPNTVDGPRTVPPASPVAAATPRSPGLETSANTDKPATVEKATPRCKAVSLSAACIRALGPALTAEVKAAVLEALRERPLRLCGAERVVIGMGANGLRVIEAPPRLSDAAQQDFLLTLRGSLDVTPRSGRIEIQCPDRDR